MDQSTQVPNHSGMSVTERYGCCDYLFDFHHIAISGFDKFSALQWKDSVPNPINLLDNLTNLALCNEKPLFLILLNKSSIVR